MIRVANSLVVAPLAGERFYGRFRHGKYDNGSAINGSRFCVGNNILISTLFDLIKPVLNALFARRHPGHFSLVGNADINPAAFGVSKRHKGLDNLAIKTGLELDRF